MTARPSVQLITNAVEAEYIHEISVRHRSRDPESGAGGNAQPRPASVLSARPPQAADTGGERFR